MTGGGMATQQHQLAPTGHGDAHQKWQGSARRQLRISGLGSLPVVRRPERMALHVGKVKGHGHPPLSHRGCDGPRRRRAAAAGGGAAWALGRTPGSPREIPYAEASAGRRRCGTLAGAGVDTAPDMGIIVAPAAAARSLGASLVIVTRATATS